MINSLSLGYGNRVSRYENKFYDKVFNACQKNVKGTEVRDADWGLYATQICLARDFVTASQEEAGLIVAKMNFIQNIINQNINQDQDIYHQEMSDKGDFLRTKAEAKAIAYPAQAQLIHSTADAASGVIDSTKELADSSLKLIGEVKSPLNLVA